MASPLYNNKTLAEQEQKRKFNIDLDQTSDPILAAEAAEFADEPSADDILAMAKAPGLGIDWDAPVSMEPIPEPRDIGASLAALRSQPDNRSGYRRVTEGLSGIGGGLGAATLGTSLVGAAPLAAVLGGAATAAQVPDYLRRWMNPESDESTPGMVESALTVLPAAASLRGLRGMSGAVSAGDDVAGLGGRALAYEGAQAPRRVIDPMQKLALASRQAPASPIEQLMETPAFSKLPRGNVSKAKPKSGSLKGLKSTAQPDLMDEFLASQGPKKNFVMDGVDYEMDAIGSHKAVKRSPIEEFYDANPGARTGGEGRMTGQFAEEAGGLGSLAARSPRGRASSTSIANDMEGDWGHGLRPNPWRELAFPAEEPLSDLQRLAARSMERFGKKYRKE